MEPRPPRARRAIKKPQGQLDHPPRVTSEKFGVSCLKCGYRFLWELEEGANKCPKCRALTDWGEKPKFDPNHAHEVERWYRNGMQDPKIGRKKFDKVSMSDDSAYLLGQPQIYKVSTSFKEPTYDEKTSLGWRPWSKIETTKLSATCTSVENFDRTYSRAYSRTYSRPYNLPEEPKEFSYSTSYTGPRRQNFNTPGSGRTVLERPGRDYKGLIQPTYQVKSYDRKAVRARGPTNELGL